MRVVIVGPGRMGVGIAQALLVAGHPVEVVDVKERSADELISVLAAARREVETGLALPRGQNAVAFGEMVGQTIDPLRIEGSGIGLWLHACVH